MNDPISWDPSLVKKFSSSNHYKLLNQLRNEVKKYPLNNKKNTSSNLNNDKNLDNKSKSNSLYNANNSQAINSSQISDDKSNKTTVSFNNSKNFSIHNKYTPNGISQQNDSFLSNHSKVD